MSHVMMSCEEAIAEFRPYAEGELEASAAAAVKEHLADCPDCCVEFHQRKKLYNFVAQSYGGKRISDGFGRSADKRLQATAAGAAVLAAPAAAAAATARPASRRMAKATSAPQAAPAEAPEEAGAQEDPNYHKQYMSSLAALMAMFGAIPCWAFSGMFHGLVITAAVLIGMALFRNDTQQTVMLTDLVRPKPKEEPPLKKPQQVLQEVEKVTVHDVKVPMPEVVVVNSDDVADVTLTVESAVAEFGEAGLDNVFNGDSGERSGVGMGGGHLGAHFGGGVPLPGGGRGMMGSIGGVPFAGKKLALIFDNSLSMQQVVEFAKKAVTEFLGEAKGKGTIDFYSEINENQAHKFHLLRGVQLRSSKDEVVKWFEGLPKGGGDRIGEAASSVYWAFAECMNEYPDMVIFVTDWKLHSPNHEYNIAKQTDEIRKILEDHKERMPKCVFFTQTANGTPRQCMEELAKLTGGTIKQVDGGKKK
ncbi:MAG: zf-HC2 domain-containing protein [Planctomycetota bacterium]|nr:zf-HC2 domain-containing protein [Planctomycetota bacterium]